MAKQFCQQKITNFLSGILDSVQIFCGNAKKGFSTYLAALRGTPSYGRNAAAVVLNANPFTLGHKALVERACRENDIVHLFGVSEEKSLIPYPVRKQLILDGCRCFPNLIYHDSGPYIISSATFPSYFQKDDVSVIRGHALLDAAVFCEIARTLGISRRYIGEEPKSLVPETTFHYFTGEAAATVIRAIQSAGEVQHY